MLSKILIILSHSSFYNFSIDFCHSGLRIEFLTRYSSQKFLRSCEHSLQSRTVRLKLIPIQPAKITYKRRKTKEKSWRNFTHDGGRAVCLRNYPKDLRRARSRVFDCHREQAEGDFSR